MDYPFIAELPNGQTVKVRNQGEHAARMIRCKHIYGWPPGVCVLCLSAEHRV